MSSAKYSLLSTQEFADGTTDAKYKSIFTYSHQPHAQSAQITTVRELQPTLGNRIILACVAALGFVFLILTLPFSGWFAVKVVPEQKRLVAFRLGRMRGVLGPGLSFVLPLLDTVVAVDVAPRAFSVPPSRAYTKDGAVIEVGANVTFQITDPQLSVLSAQDTNGSLRAISQTTLLRYLAILKLSDIQASLMSVNKYMQIELSRAVKQWGVTVTRVEVSPPRLLHMLPEPDAMQDIKAVLSALFNGPAAQQQPADARQMQQHQPSSLPFMFGAGGSNSAAAAFMSEVGAESALARISSLVNEDVVHSVSAVYEFELTGPGGGIYYLDLKHGCGSAGKGKPPGDDADVVISLPATDIQGFLDGSVSPLHAYLSGQISVSGDLHLATRLSTLASGLK